MPILNCRVFICKFNDKGKCRLERITLQDDGSPITGKVICIKAESKDNDAKPLDIETIWGIPEADLPGSAPAFYPATGLPAPASPDANQDGRKENIC